MSDIVMSSLPLRVGLINPLVLVPLEIKLLSVIMSCLSDYWANILLVTNLINVPNFTVAKFPSVLTTDAEWIKLKSNMKKYIQNTQQTTKQTIGFG